MRLQIPSFGVDHLTIYLPIFLSRLFSPMCMVCQIPRLRVYWPVWLLHFILARSNVHPVPTKAFLFVDSHLRALFQKDSLLQHLALPFPWRFISNLRAAAQVYVGQIYSSRTPRHSNQFFKYHDTAIRLGTRHHSALEHHLNLNSLLDANRECLRSIIARICSSPLWATARHCSWDLDTWSWAPWPRNLSLSVEAFMIFPQLHLETVFGRSLRSGQAR